MAPRKFVIKCGNFAVLVDLHILPLGGQEEVSWFTTDHIEEVTALVRVAVDQRARQYTEFLQNRRRVKQKKDLPPASAFFAKDLRVFPERYLVCVSCPEEALAQQRNPSVAATKVSEQSRSEYFPSVGGGDLNCSTTAKKMTLQKIAKQAHTHQERCGSSTVKQQNEQSSCPKIQRTNPKYQESEANTEIISSSTTLSEEGEQTGTTDKHGWQTSTSGIEALAHEVKQDTCKRRKLSDAGEDPDSQMAKRTCLGGPPETIQTLSTDCSSLTAKHDLLLPIQAKAESKAFPVSECKKTTVEVELLTPGKRAQRLPLTSNNAAQTNQNRLAASLRGLSVKPTSLCSSIGSRSTLAEERNENVPRTSRLRRLKRS
ncbi:protein SLX4IP isoform X2 [Gouania willdenowi]|uniref:Protein SLX4IP n=1 Tax=Gouania willdenowi TaxID=441366 RepID=A0A8C5NGR1_GOUWI|nr:protein SLX4IP isoform X2 [Gouania willdenowi]